MLPDMTPWGSDWPIDTADPVNRHHPINQGRLAWWLCLPPWMGGQTWFDLMGLCHASYAAGFADPAEGWRGTFRPGGYGELRSLSGFGYLDAGPCPSLQVQSHTFAGWFYYTGADNTALVSRASITTDGYEWAVYGGTFNYAFFDSTIRGYYIGPAVVANTWTHYAGTWNQGAGQVQFYRDGLPVGAPVATTTGPITHNAARHFLTGSEPFGARLQGHMDDFSLWGRVLSASEMRAVYDLSRTGYPGVLNRLPLSVQAGSAATPGGGGGGGGSLTLMGAGR